MKKWFLLAASLVLMVSFQNCSKLAVPLVSDSDFDQQSIEDFDKIVFGSYAIGVEYTLELDKIDQGIVTAVKLDNQGVPANNGIRCLTQENIITLKAILAEAKICRDARFELPADIACTMIYVNPYGAVLNSLERVNLGEMKNGCDVPNRLCDGKDDALKTFSNLMVLSLESQPCLEATN